MLRRILPILVVLCGLLWNRSAHASHFRYGTINWTVPDPVGAPLTVKFTVDAAWRAAMPDVTTLQFGDGQQNPATQGTLIGTGTDAAGGAYNLYEYTTTHTYASAGTFTAFFTGSARIAGLQNGANAPYTVQTVVDLTAGNTGGPVSQAPAVIQMQVGAVRTYLFPAYDPDGDTITCRFATSAETGLPVGQEIPAAVPTGIKPTLSQACLVTWDLTGAAFVDQYVLHLVLESSHGGKVSSTAIDLIVETINSPPPTCTGSGTFVVPVGQAFSQQVTGTNAGGGSLLFNSLNAPMGATVNPMNGSMQMSPFNDTLSWTPTAAFAGTTQIVAMNFTNTSNITGTCFITIQVPSCANYGTPCSAGVGECKVNGINVCQGPNTVCNAVAGMPQPETCDGKDNDCDGVNDNGNPGSGQTCSTGLPGVCDVGTTNCTMGELKCDTVTMPGQQMEICGDMLDSDCDGMTDNGCPDSDGDGIIDAIEIANGTDPMDADSDDDGVPDGQEPNWNEDTDGDGLINALDPDSDNDGLFDGTEMGRDCGGPGTDMSKHHCIPDADMGMTKTDPLNRDTDGGGASDGSEDWNRDGKVDPGETDPTAGHPGDDSTVVDTDGDGLGDLFEIAIHSNPNDADSDDDGVIDGKEPNPTCDDDHDGMIDVLDADSDNDALFDGTEMGLDCSNPDTDKAKMCCIPDADDGGTQTSPLEKDTDHGGMSDGSEDWNRNGKIDPGETDPTKGHGADDGTIKDSDGDGLGDDLEGTLGSNPMDADSDDDGVPDGMEPNPGQDVDGDGMIDVLDPDSDGDGLKDGTEMGYPCTNPATDNTKMNCVPDKDMGQTTTSPINPDTDFGGIKDGVEDKNKDGAIDAGETDPNDPTDDKPCKTDTDCGGAMSGQVCDDMNKVCEPGCRGTGGNGCPDPMKCTSTDMTIGQCVDCNTDSDCGPKDSGKICDTSTHTCGDGCRGTNGNGCPDPKKCTSVDDKPGMCVECDSDSDCGSATSGKICDTSTHTCGDGCRGMGGNSCPEGMECSSHDQSAGTCKEPDGIIVEGNGILCSASPANDNSSNVGWMLGSALGLLVAVRRRRRK